VTRIGDVWFDLRPALPNPQAVSLRWRKAPGYPAPSWSMDAPGWPVFPGGTGGASPIVESWWNPDAPFPADGNWLQPTGLPITFLKGKTSTFGDTTLTLDQVETEEHLVEGKSEPQKCLVVRLSHSMLSPAWVRPIGSVAEGSEIRVYRAANKVTCLFWGIDTDKVTGFEVVLLNNALKKAKELGHTAVLNTLPAPFVNSPRPEPPVEVR
jgi:hypothetical protein